MNNGSSSCIATIHASALVFKKMMKTTYDQDEPEGHDTLQVSTSARERQEQLERNERSCGAEGVGRQGRRGRRAARAHADSTRCWRIYSGRTMPDTSRWRWGSSVRVWIDVSCGEREEKRRADAHSGSTYRPKLCQFAVIVSWHSGEGGFGGKTNELGGGGGRKERHGSEEGTEDG